MSRGTSPATPAGRRLDLEGYRGIAALGVVVFHAYQFNRGDAGAHYAYEGSVAFPLLRNLDGLVNLFFVLSAYLLYAPLVRAVRAGERPQPVRVFLFRRAVRILPLYWAAILVVWAARNPRLPGDWRDLLEHLTGTQVFDSKRIFWTIGPAWSLAVEIYFYLALAGVYLAFRSPAASRLSPRAGRWALWLFPITLAAVGLAWKAAALLAGEPATRWSVWFNPLAKADVFAAGTLLALAAGGRDGRPLRRGPLLAVRLAGCALIIAGGALRTDAPARATAFGLLSTAGFALLILSSILAPDSSWYRRALATRWLTWFGVISYSLYLWHEPVLLFLDGKLGLEHAPSHFLITAALLLATAIPVAVASNRLVEQPFNRLRRLIGSDGARLDPYADLLKPVTAEPPAMMLSR